MKYLGSAVVVVVVVGSPVVVVVVVGSPVVVVVSVPHGTLVTSQLSVPFADGGPHGQSSSHGLISISQSSRLVDHRYSHSIRHGSGVVVVVEVVVVVG